jgi:hypothetical protein
LKNSFDKYNTLLPDLGSLLEEARNSENSYQMKFDIEYVIDHDYVLAATNKIFELGLASHSSIIEGPRSIAKLVGSGTAGLESIIKFDGWLSLTKALDFAAMQRIQSLEIEEKSAFRLRIHKFLKRHPIIPSNSFIEAEIRAAYKLHGLEI